MLGKHARIKYYSLKYSSGKDIILKSIEKQIFLFFCIAQIDISNMHEVFRKCDPQYYLYASA